MKMNEIDRCIQVVAKDDLRARKGLFREINGYLHGVIKFTDLTLDSQRIIQINSNI